MSEEACRSPHRNRLIHRPRTRRRPRPRFGRARLPNDLKTPAKLRTMIVRRILLRLRTRRAKAQRYTTARHAFRPSSTKPAA
jgi:hypothetical protein